MEQQNDTPLDRTLAELQEHLGDRAVAIYRYGSSFGQTARGPRIRLLLVVDALDRSLLDRLVPITREAREQGVSIRIETQEGLLRGADAFPVFALELRDTAELLHGEDVVAGVEIQPDRLRLRLEQSLRAIHRDMARVYLEHGGALGQLATELRLVARRLVYLFEATLIAAGRAVPAAKSPTTIIAAFCKELRDGAGQETWDRLRRLAASEETPDRDALMALYADVLVELGQVVMVVDQMEE